MTICQLIITIIIFGVLLIFTYFCIQKNESEINPVILVILLVCFIPMANYLLIAYDGIKKGANWENIKTMSVTEYKEHCIAYPHMETNKDNIKAPCLVIYTKFSCNDCLAVLPSLQKDLQKTNAPVHYVSTGTNLGKELLQNYPVTKVPMLLYLDKKGNAFYCSPIKTAGISVSYDEDAVKQFLAHLN